MKTSRLGVTLPLCITLLAASLCAATIKYDVTKLDSSAPGTGGGGMSGSSVNLQRYTYYVTDITLGTDQELDIRFDPKLFASLSNATAGPNFDVLLFQPNQPAGAFGDFSVLSLVDQATSTVTFSVDFQYLGRGVSGPQPYFINQFDANGGFRTLELGLTSPAQATAVPEPATLLLCGAAFLAWCALRAARR